MKNYGHGDHWQCVTTLEKLMSSQLEQFVADGKIQNTAEVNGVFTENEIQTKETIVSISGSNENLSTLSLLLN